MQKYKTLQVVRIGAGVAVLLNDRQAKDRQHVLQAKGKAKDGEGLYEALAVLEFKAGEVVGLENPGKWLWEMLAPVGQEKTIFELYQDKLSAAEAEGKAKVAAEAQAKDKKSGAKE